MAKQNKPKSQAASSDAICEGYTTGNLHKLTRVIEMSCALAGYVDLDSLLQKIVNSAVELAGAEFGGVLVMHQDKTHYEYFKVFGCSHEPSEFPTGAGVLGIPHEEGHPLRSDDIRKHPRAVGIPHGHPEVKAFVGVPLRVRDKVFGSLFVGNSPGEGSFSREDQALLVAFAAQAAMAIENAQLYERTEQLAKLEERKRIAQSLHETVLQYLFTVGLEVEKCLEQADPCLEKLSMIQRLIDRASEELRSTIFALSFHSSVNMKGLPAILTDLIEELKTTSGIRSSLLLPRDLPEMPLAVSEAIYRIVREALSNVKKHARASAVAVTLSYDKRFVSVTIQDNGRGLDTPSTPGLHFGLLTMKQVASNANGEITILSNEDDGGTIVRATFPMLGGRKETQ